MRFAAFNASTPPCATTAESTIARARAADSTIDCVWAAAPGAKIAHAIVAVKRMMVFMSGWVATPHSFNRHSRRTITRVTETVAGGITADNPTADFGYRGLGRRFSA